MIEDIERHFLYAKAAKVETSTLLGKVGELRKKIDNAPRTFSTQQLAAEYLGEDPGTPERVDAGQKARLEATLKGLYDRIGELEERYVMERGEFRSAVFAAIEEEFEAAVFSYEARAQALVDAFEELVSLNRFFTEHGSRSRLPNDFATSANIPNVDAARPALLDGRQTRMYKARIEDILPDEEARAIFVGAFEVRVEPPEPEPYYPPRKDAPIGGN